MQEAFDPDFAPIDLREKISVYASDESIYNLVVQSGWLETGTPSLPSVTDIEPVGVRIVERDYYHMNT